MILRVERLGIGWRATFFFLASSLEHMNGIAAETDREATQDFGIRLKETGDTKHCAHKSTDWKAPMKIAGH